jgi:hypothetical protein
MASRYDAIQAIALCKPCVVVGNHGLGGRVTPENYETFKRHGFKGRNGAACDEHVPLDLLCFDIQRTLNQSYEDEMIKIHDLILADGYSFSVFHKGIMQTVDQVLKLHDSLHNRQLHKTLKPRSTSTLHIQKVDDKNIITCGHSVLAEVDDDLVTLLKQCNGDQTIEEVVIGNGYEQRDVRTFAENIIELWKKKLVVFNFNH